MDHAAQDLMEEYPDIVLAFGESDEFRFVPYSPLFLHLPLSTKTPTRSFLLRKSTSLYNRRQSKIVSTLTSLFTSSYVFHWSLYFPDTPLVYPPSFDGRIVLYPGTKEVKDYFAWRQADSTFCSCSLGRTGSETDFDLQRTLITCITRHFGPSYSRADRRRRRPILRYGYPHFSFHHTWQFSFLARGRLRKINTKSYSRDLE